MKHLLAQLFLLSVSHSRIPFIQEDSNCIAMPRILTNHLPFNTVLFQSPEEDKYETSDIQLQR